MERRQSDAADESRESGHEQGAPGLETATRRAFVATGAAVSGVALGGCLGGDGGNGNGNGDNGGNGDGGNGNGGNGGATTTGSSEPEPPWTTEQLRDHIDTGSTVTIYAGTGDAQQWIDLIEVINDEFDTNIEGDVFAGNGGEVSQRFVQEKQSNNDRADLISNASDIQDEIKINGEEAAEPYFEWDMDRNFWFNDVLPDRQQLPFMTGTFNGGAGSCLPLNADIFEDRGLDIPESYNDLFEDQYEGLDTLIPGFVVPGEVGWIVDHHADETDMDNVEWITALRDHLNFVGAGSYTGATREVAQGNAPMMFFNWPWVVAPFAKDPEMSLRGQFPSPVKSEALAGPLSINTDAPRPWVARFFVSAMLEESVQRRMINEVTDQVPVRLDLDYSPQDPHPFTRRRLNTDLVEIDFFEGGEFAEVGQTLKDNGAFEV
jgi:hypothetical protein